MMRKLLIVSFLISLVFSAYSQNRPTEKALIKNGSNAKVDHKAIGAPMPYLRAFTKQGTYITSNDLDNDANLFVMLFNPTCEHCEDEARILKDNLSLFKKSKIVFLAASGMGPYLSYFSKNTRMDSVTAIPIAIDSSGYIDKAFNYKSLPQINVYDKERKLIRTFNGANPIDSLKNYIE